MVKTATFSFRSDKYGGIEETETFTFEEIGIDEHMDKEAYGKRNDANSRGLDLA